MYKGSSFKRIDYASSDGVVIHENHLSKLIQACISDSLE